MDVKQMKVPRVTVRPEVVYHVTVGGEKMPHVFRETGSLAGMKQLRSRGA